MVNKRKIVLIITVSIVFLVLLIITNYYITNHFSISNDRSYNLFNSKLYTLEKSLIGKTIFSVDKIIGENNWLINKNKIVLLYTGMDCGTCVEKAFSLAKKIDSLIKRNRTIIIGSNTNIGRDQVINDYKEFILTDNEELIRKELKFIYTPVFMVIDSNKRISKIFFQTLNNDGSKEEHLLNYVKSIFLK